MDEPDREKVATNLRERARRVRSRMLERYGDAPEREPVVADPENFSAPKSFPGSVDEQLEYFGGVGGLAVVDDGRVLCVEVGYHDVGWTTPGGAQDPGETLAETALRETREEANVEAAITGVLFHREFALDYGHDRLVRLPAVVFTGQKTGGRRAVPARRTGFGPPEITDVRWFGPEELPPDVRDREWLRELLGAGTW